MHTSTATLQAIFIALLFPIFSNSAFSQSNLVAYFPFDGNTTDVSSSPNLAQSQGITYCPDRFGQANSAVRFDASSDRILVPQTTFNVNALDAITISFWMRREGFDFPGYNPHLAFLGEYRNYTLMVDMEYPGNIYTPQNRDLVVFSNYSNIANFNYAFHPNPVNNAAWHHCAAVINKSTSQVELFIDGVSASQSSFLYNQPSASILTIGNHPWLDWAFLGDLDEFRIHNRALSQSEITTLMNGSNATTCTNNLLANPSFATNLSNWNGTGGTWQTGNLELCQTGQLAYQTLAAQAGQNYQFHYTAKTAGANQNVLFGIKFLSSTWNVLATNYSSFDSPTGFTSNFIEKLAPAGTAWVEVSIVKQNSGCVQVSEVCLTKDGGANPLPCSLNVVVTDIRCLDSGSSSLSTDDRFDFNLTVTGTNVGSTGWQTSVNGQIILGQPTVGIYAVKTSLLGGLISNGQLNFQVSDRTNPSCFTSVSITPPAPCSGPTLCSDNLLTNPDFLDQSGWQLSGNLNGLLIQNGFLQFCASGDRATQKLRADPLQPYSFRFKGVAPASTILFKMEFLSISNLVLSSETFTYQNLYLDERFLNMVAPSGTYWVEVSAAVNSNGCVNVSEVCLRKNGSNPCSNDVTPPVISACPQSITISSTAPSPTWTAPTATDNCPGAVTVTGSATSGQAFAVGATTVTYTARDAANNTSTCSFVITVQAPPTGGGCVNNLLQNASFDNGLTTWNGTGGITQNGNLELCQIGDLRYQTVAAEAGKTYQFHYTAKTAGTNQNVLFGLKFLSSSWNVLGSEYSSFDSPGAFGSNFIQKVAPVGTTWVEVSIAKQNSGCVQVSEVCLTKDGGTPNPCTNDVTPPVISACPQSITISSTAPNPTWAAPTATDNCSGALPMTSTHSSGQQFAVGATTVTYTARDAAQNTSTCSFIVTVTQGVGNPNCSIMASFPWQDWISEVKVNSTVNTSGKAQYTNYTTPVFTAMRGGTTAIELTTSYSYFTYDEYYRVWIDYNQDNIYQASEIAYQGILTRPADGTASKKLMGTFTIPNTAILGNTKMRVIMRRGAYPVDACTNIVEGEVEDYSFNIAVQALQSSSGNAVVETDPFNEVLIYPNPATGQAFIDLTVLKGAPTVIRIFDAYGKLHHSTSSTAAVVELDLAGWESGVYMVRLETEGARARVMKLVVVGL